MQQGQPTDQQPVVAPPPGQRSQAKLWATGAAVASAFAGLVSAGVAIFGSGSPSAAPPLPVPAVTVTVPPGQSGQPVPATAGAAPTSAPAVSPAAPAAPAGAVRWSGAVVLGMEGIDLEQVPPRKGTDSLYSDRPRAAREGSSGMQIQGTSARWTGSGEATAQGCRELLATQSVDAVVVGVGQTVCVVNDHSPIAALKVTGTRYKEGSYGLIEGQLTVWDLRADGS